MTIIDKGKEMYELQVLSLSENYLEGNFNPNFNIFYWKDVPVFSESDNSQKNRNTSNILIKNKVKIASLTRTCIETIIDRHQIWLYRIYRIKKYQKLHICKKKIYQYWIL